MARCLEVPPDMRTVSPHQTSGFTLLEVSVVLSIMGVLAAMAWPLTSAWLDRAELVVATDTLRSDIRKAQQEARANGRMFELRVNAAQGQYVVGPVGRAGRVSRLQAGLRFGSPDSENSDGVTFRDNVVRFSPQPGLQNSFGSITVRSREGARRVTVSITGHTSIAAWNGREWQ